MTKDVLIRISGLQRMDDQSDDVEVITTGDYFQKNGKHYVIYEELLEGVEGMIRNTVKITPEMLDIRKSGVINTHMVFEKDQKKMTRYATPMGDMMIGINTNQIQLQEQEDRLNVSVEYSLDINYEPMSVCNITLDVCSKEKAQLNL